MQLQPMKRSICLLLAMVMVFSMLPLQSFAAGTEDHIHAAEDADQALYQQLQSRTDGFLETHLGTTLMMEEQILAAVGAMDPDSIRTARRELGSLAEQFALLTEDRLLAFGAENPTFVTFADRIMSDEAWGDDNCFANELKQV